MSALCLRALMSAPGSSRGLETLDRHSGSRRPGGAVRSGPGDIAKTAERLREGLTPRLDLCVVARMDGRLVGLRPAMADPGRARPPPCSSGPIALWIRISDRTAWAPHWSSGRAPSPKAPGYGHVVLVGDLAFFGPLGFAVARGVILPGPVDPRRVLARGPSTEPAISGAVIKLKLDHTGTRPCSAQS